MREHFVAARRQREHDHEAWLAGEADPGAVEQMNRYGFARLGNLLSPRQVAEVRAHFENLSCLNSYIVEDSDRVLRPLDAVKNQWSFACYALGDVIAAPHLLEIANDPEFSRQ